MDEAPKDIVEHAYDEIADWYLGWVEGQRSPRETFTEKVLKDAGSSPRILELGCGAGIPITRMLLDLGAEVVANDISSKQVSMAKQRCPGASFHAGDMTALTFEPASFDGAVSFYAIFHLPRAEQKGMLAKVHSWVKPCALFALNLATMDEEEIHGEFHGRGMFWSSYAVEDSKAMFEEVGFELVEADVLEAGDGKLDESDPDYGVKFLWIVARKPVP